MSSTTAMTPTIISLPLTTLTAPTAGISTLAVTPTSSPALWTRTATCGPHGGTTATAGRHRASLPPASKAFSELGRAVKTIFLCQYLHSEALRREINEGLNIVEQWNSANDFIFFARRGEMVSNRREDHEISMLALHLLQNCMVYINTLMLQQVLAQPQWPGKLTTRDLGALTPLIWEHVNPYGRFELDMEARLPID